MLDSTRSGMTRTSSHVASIYDNDFLELVWENGQVVMRGGSSNRTQKSTTPSCIGYSISPSLNNEEKIDEDASITKRTRLNTLYSLLDQFPAQRDSDTSSSHQSNGQDSCQSSQSKNSSKFNEDFANLLRPVKDSKPVTTANSDHLCIDSSQQCFPSAPLKKQITDSSQTPATNSHNMGCDQRTGNKVNFSNFLVPAVFVKSTTYHGNSATQQTRNASSAGVMEEIGAGKVDKAASESAKESHDLKGFQNQTSLTANKLNPASFVEKSTEPPLPLDEQSAAVGHNSGALGVHRSHVQRFNQTSNPEALREKRKADNNLCNEPLLGSSSVCSLGASNDPNVGIGKLEDTDDSAYLSDNDGEQEDIVKQTQDRDGNRVKRSRNAEVHNLSEKKRREKINKRMRTLKELIPNCNKVDKASMLDDAIDYLKTLKLQLQIMSMGSGLWPLMMLPGAAHHINGPHLPQLMGAGMGFRPPQLPIPPLSPITDNRLQMFGFSNQIPHMPMPHASFFPMIIGNSSTQAHLANTTATTNNLAEHLHVSVPNNSDLHAKAQNATMQVPNQVSLHHHSTTSIPYVFPQK